jgi:hypothetical protein
MVKAGAPDSSARRRPVSAGLETVRGVTMGTFSSAGLVCMAMLGAIVPVAGPAYASQAGELSPSALPPRAAPPLSTVIIEPTDAEMQAVIKRGLDAVAADSRKDTAACGRASASASDPAAALICLGGALMGASGLAGRIKITHFEKLGCTPASGAPGLVCDYRLSVSSGPGRLRGPEVAAIVGPGGIARARFLKTPDSWVAFFQDVR